MSPCVPLNREESHCNHSCLRSSLETAGASSPGRQVGTVHGGPGAEPLPALLPNLRKAAASSKCELIRAVSAIMCPRNAHRNRQRPGKDKDHTNVKCCLPRKGVLPGLTLHPPRGGPLIPPSSGTAEWPRQGHPNTAQSFALVYRSAENKTQRRDITQPSQEDKNRAQHRAGIQGDLA